MDDAVDEAVLEHELRALETLRQRRPDRFRNDARAGEADQRARLGQRNVAQKREAGRDTRRGRIGQSSCGLA